jgi:biotin-(acetyl-CoA carboxylase) ligase
VNQRAEDFSDELRPRAISLAMALNREVDRHRFAIALLRNLDASYQKIFCGGSSSPLSASRTDSSGGELDANNSAPPAPN